MKIKVQINDLGNTIVTLEAQLKDPNHIAGVQGIFFPGGDLYSVCTYNQRRGDGGTASFDCRHELAPWLPLFVQFGAKTADLNIVDHCHTFGVVETMLKDNVRHIFIRQNYPNRMAGLTGNIDATGRLVEVCVVDTSHKIPRVRFDNQQALEVFYPMFVQYGATSV